MLPTAFFLALLAKHQTPQLVSAALQDTNSMKFQALAWKFLLVLLAVRYARWVTVSRMQHAWLVQLKIANLATSTN